MTRLLLFVSAVMCILLLAAGFFLAGSWMPTLVFLLLSAVWLVGLARRWNWAAAYGLFLSFDFAAFGFFQNTHGNLVVSIEPAFLVTGALLAFASWDLADFSSRLRLAAPQDDIAALERRHLLRLFVLIILGGLLAYAAPNLRARLSFEWVVVILLFVVWGISRLVRWLMKPAEE